MRSRYGAGVRFGMACVAFFHCCALLMPFGIINNSKEYMHEGFYRMQTAKGNISSRRNINKILLEY